MLSGVWCVVCVGVVGVGRCVLNAARWVGWRWSVLHTLRSAQYASVVQLRGTERAGRVTLGSQGATYGSKLSRGRHATTMHPSVTLVRHVTLGCAGAFMERDWARVGRSACRRCAELLPLIASLLSQSSLAAVAIRRNPSGPGHCAPRASKDGWVANALSGSMHAESISDPGPRRMRRAHPLGQHRCVSLITQPPS